MTRRDPPIRVGPARASGLASRRTWPRVALAAAVAAALAFGLGWQLGRPSGSSAGSGAAPAELEARLAALDDALRAEREARGALAQELAALRTLMEGIAAQLPAGETARAVEATTSPAPTPTPGAEAQAEAGAAAAPPLFDLEALVSGCMDRREAEQLRTRWERYELDRLELNDRARREGFFMTPRHRDEHRALDVSFRSEVGDDGFDAYLRATGKPNRVTIRELLPTGAGRAAGLEVGDELVEYAGVRVFSTADLQLLTASGRAGELVPVEVVRGGQTLSFRVTRGPLGMVLDAVQRAPQGGC